MGESLYIVGILGSPRISGNTDILITEALKGAAAAGAKVDRFELNAMTYAPCQECGGCELDGRCVLGDDMDKIYEAVSQANGIIVATPVFFGSMSAQTKMMIDRFQSWWVGKYILKKSPLESGNRLGIFICVGAFETPRYCENAASIIKVWFHTINVTADRFLMYQGFDEAGSIRQHPTAVTEAYEAGLKLVKKLIDIKKEC